METRTIVNGKPFALIIELTPNDAKEIASVLSYEYISAEKPVLKRLVNDIVNFASKNR